MRDADADPVGALDDALGSSAPAFWLAHGLEQLHAVGLPSSLSAPRPVGLSTAERRHQTGIAAGIPLPRHPPRGWKPSAARGPTDLDHALVCWCGGSRWARRFGPVAPWPNSWQWRSSWPRPVEQPGGSSEVRGGEAASRKTWGSPESSPVPRNPRPRPAPGRTARRMQRPPTYRWIHVLCRVPRRGGLAE